MIEKNQFQRNFRFRRKVYKLKNLIYINNI